MHRSKSFGTHPVNATYNARYLALPRIALPRIAIVLAGICGGVLFAGCGSNTQATRHSIVVRETPVPGEDTSDVFAATQAPAVAAVPANEPTPSTDKPAAPAKPAPEPTAKPAEKTAARPTPAAPEIALANKPAPAPAPQAQPHEDATEQPIQPVDVNRPGARRPPRREPPSATPNEPARTAETPKSTAAPAAKPTDTVVASREPAESAQQAGTPTESAATARAEKPMPAEPPANQPAVKPAPAATPAPDRPAPDRPAAPAADRTRPPLPAAPPKIDTTPRTGLPVHAAPRRAARPRQTAPFDSPPFDFDVVSMKLEADFTQEDFDAKRMRAIVTYDLRSRGGGDRTLELDCVGPKVDRVEAGPDWRPLVFTTDFDSLDIDLPARTTAGQRLQLRISYKVEKAKLGLFFAGADDDFVVYTNAEPIEARYWLPCHDWPDTRFGASEVIITTPADFSAVSVGAPVGPPALADGRATSHWRLDAPIDPHLFGFVVGRFTTLQFDGGPVPVYAYVQRDHEEAARESFADAPAILTYYQKLIGINYPFPQFSHVSVPGHFHGGMEQAGFDMIAPAMYEALGSSDRTQFDYIAHMIAHAWFAGITSYAHVTEAWVNEGFATYLHQNWMRERKGEAAFEREMRRARAMIVSFGALGSSEPLVNRAISRPGEIYEFGGGLVYYKGSWVLHMLRHELGEATFWAGVRRYLEDNRGRGAVTDDLQAAFEEASGRDLSEFFEQWVYLRGVPELSIAWKWDEKLGAAVVTVKQTQKIDDRRPRFAFPLDLAFDVGDEKRTETVHVSGAEQVFEIALPRKPERLDADPGLFLLAQISVSNSE